MKTSHRGVLAIEGREGVILHGYKDSKGLLTIGCGHLVKHGEPYTLGGKITQSECDRLLEQDLAIAENAVNGAVRVPLTQNQFDALVSFTVNIGTGGFKSSAVVKKLNAHDYNGAAQAFMHWVTPPEIAGRRRTEVKQFLTPYPNSAAPSATAATSTIDPSPVIESTTELPVPPTTTVETTQTTVESADGTQATATTTTATVTAPVTVKSVALGLWTKIVAVIAALTGLGINAGTVIETKLSEITLNQIFLAGMGVGLLVVAIWYIKVRQAANDIKTHALIDAAASKDKNTVLLTK